MKNKRAQLAKITQKMWVHYVHTGVLPQSYLQEMFTLFEEDDPTNRERWKPGQYQAYYWIDSTGEVVETRWCDDILDSLQWDFKNVFQTKEQAWQAHEKIKEVLAHLHRWQDRRYKSSLNLSDFVGG